MGRGRMRAPERLVSMSRVYRTWLFAALILGTALGTSAQTFSTVFDFDETDGATPYYVLLAQGRDGSFYGTTEEGGGEGAFGTLFRVTSSGELLDIPANGPFPYAGLVLADDGSLYGTTQDGGPYCRGS